jgi:hypothetical protein
MIRFSSLRGSLMFAMSWLFLGMSFGASSSIRNLMLSGDVLS